ncbi:ribonuclease P protein subunit drpp30 [Hyalella azteca]|uniref:Ribonuclease P protein subunit drpp30 n=1 Tax=Hyalella azteca TaxID=294128 RepID=A0A8B7PDG5_HYAAZ|nr:ribonuclease P protein subunit drpp30 [Hyalella azteca]
MQKKAVGYCDLNILSDSKDLKKTVLEALRLGFQTIAINTVVHTEPSYEESKSNKKKDSGNKGDQCIIPAPTRVSLSPDDLKQYGIAEEPVLLSRLTLVYKDTTRPFLHKAKAAIEEYDVVAFTPLSEEAFKQVCQSLMYVDIICLDPDSQLCSSKLPRNLCRLAVERDMYFELQYGPCIGSRNISSWQSTIRLGHLLSDYINSRNVIVTSATASPEPIRSPADVIAMARFFGLSLGAAHSSVSALCHDTVHCALQRRAGANKCNVLIDFGDNVSKDNVANRKNAPKRKAGEML